MGAYIGLSSEIGWKALIGASALIGTNTVSKIICLLLQNTFNWLLIPSFLFFFRQLDKPKPFTEHHGGINTQPDSRS